MSDPDKKDKTIKDKAASVKEEKSSKRKGGLSDSGEDTTSGKFSHASGEEKAPNESYADDNNEWPLQADRVALHNPLVECLRVLAGFYGRRTSMAALTAGLPIGKSGITPLLFLRAAERADMRANMAERTLESLAIAPNLPCIVTLNHGQACIIWGIEHPKGKNPKKGRKNKNITLDPGTIFTVQFPETKDEKQVIALEELQKLYTGYAFFVRPIARSDERAAQPRLIMPATGSGPR